MSRERRTVDTIVTARVVVPMTTARDVIPNGTIAIAGGRILAVGPAASVHRDYSAHRVIDTGNAVVLPGFVDLHAHVPQTFLRGQYQGVAKGTVFIPFLATPLITPEWTRVLGRVGVLEALSRGTTTVLASINRGGDAAGNGISSAPLINSGGVYVVFFSGATDLLPEAHSHPSWKRVGLTVAGFAFTFAVARVAT